MAPTGRDFATMLDEMLAAEEAARHGAGAIRGVDFLAAMDELRVGGIVADNRVAAARYGEVAGDDYGDRAEPQPAPKPAIRPLPSLDPADIGRELGLAAQRTLSGLDAARRRFAFANHPDRVPSDRRERAEQRMRIANTLVDEAKRKIRG